jgi:hypothetical protein
MEDGAESKGEAKALQNGGFRIKDYGLRRTKALQNGEVRITD